MCLWELVGGGAGKKKEIAFCSPPTPRPPVRPRRRIRFMPRRRRDIVCNEFGCNSVAKKRGLCARCYGVRYNVRQGLEACMISGCTRRRTRRMFCRFHWDEFSPLKSHKVVMDKPHAAAPPEALPPVSPPSTGEPRTRFVRELLHNERAVSKRTEDYLQPDVLLRTALATKHLLEEQQTQQHHHSVDPNAG